MSIELEAKIEGLLYYKGEEVSIKEISRLLEVKEEEVIESLDKLEANLSNRGIVLVRQNDKVVLGITAELSDLITSLRKEEINRDLSKASLETLSIVLYKNGVTRSEIDFIRGVNSSFILRSLLIRGLIEKVTKTKNSRRVLYKPTIETLSYMNVKKIEDLPNYTEVVSKLEENLNQQNKND